MGNYSVFGHKPRWVQAFYNVFGSKLQKYYNKIKGYNDPVLNKFCKQLVERFPKIATQAMGFVIAIYTKYGPAKAHKLVKKLMGDVKDTLK